MHLAVAEIMWVGKERALFALPVDQQIQRRTVLRVAFAFAFDDPIGIRVRIRRHFDNGTPHHPFVSARSQLPANPTITTTSGRLGDNATHRPSRELPIRKLGGPSVRPVPAPIRRVELATGAAREFGGVFGSADGGGEGEGGFAEAFFGAVGSAEVDDAQVGRDQIVG